MDRHLRTRRQRDWLAAAGLSLVVFVGWAMAYRLFDDRRWADPLSYEGDAHYSAAVVTAAARGDFLPFLSKELPSLGAPFVASWNDFPMSEDVLYFLVGVVARFVGVFLAINLGLLVASVLAGLSFFFVARRLHLGRPFVFMGAVLFALSPFLFARGVHHYSLSFYFVAPWQVLVSTWLASRGGVLFGSRRFTISALVVVGTAWSMVYFFFFGLQLWTIGFVAGRLRHGKRPVHTRAFLALLGLSLGGALLVNLDSLVWLAKHGPNPAAVVRSKNDVEQYALKTVDFFLPGGNHRFAAGRALAKQGAATRVTSGEAPSPYLGVLGGLSLLALLGYGFVRIARRSLDLPATWALMAIWLILFHTVGGGSSFMGVLGATLLRSVNRVSILVFVYALLFVAWALPRWLRRLPAASHWGLAVGLGILGAWEATPEGTAESVAQGHRVAQSDRQLVEEAEAVLPPGSLVFELPPMHFPESPAAAVDAYELFRPYFFSKHLVYSFGDVKGRPNANWKFGVASRPLPELYAELKRKGFAAVYVNFKAYGGPGVLEQFKGAGGTVIALAQAKDSAFIRLP